MQKNIFAFTDCAPAYPEFLSVNQQPDGRITVTVRGPKKSFSEEISYDMPGDTAAMSLPRQCVPDLIQALLALPPVSDVAEAKPLVLYFATDADREECIAAFKEVKPNARAVRV